MLKVCDAIRLACLIALAGLDPRPLLAVATNGSDAGPGPVQFNRDIRPILSDNCFLCHGFDKNHRKAKLRLDVRDVAIDREAIVPGKPDESELIKRILTDDEDDIMPPPSTHKKLSAAQKDLLVRWIAEGAEYQPHWAYIAPQRPPVPTIHNPQSAIRNPIDAFILQAIEAKKIPPSPEADKRALLRRLSLDLIGLPPTPEEVNAFVNDTRPDAYERQVERLLNSPHFGERMAVPWLDVVRFADTVGYHGDQNQNIFPYRDYVIDSFNRNKRFDQFTVEQIAGDLLPEPSTEARVATGFNRLNMMTREGGAQPKEYLAKYQADRVRTVSGAWMGSTMACAECHDHKYDPITTKDFYQLGAFFADVKQWGVYADYGYTPNPDLKGVGNDHPFPPEIEVDSPYLKRRVARLQKQASKVYAAAGDKLNSSQQAKAAFSEWRDASLAFLKQSPDGWFAPAPEVALKLKDAKLAVETNFTVQADATVTLTSAAKENLTLTLPLPAMTISAIRIEIVPQQNALQKGNARQQRANATIAPGAQLVSRETGATNKLAFHHAEATHKQERYAGGQPIIGVKNGWQVSTEHDEQSAVWLLEKPLRVNEGDSLAINLGGAALASARVSVSPFAAEEPLLAGNGEALRTILGKAPEEQTARERDRLNRAYLFSAHWDGKLLAQARQLQSEIRECRGGRAFTQVTEAREPMEMRVLPRGNWQDDSGEVVQPGVPHFLPQILNPENRRLTRLDLAQWLVSRDNPLTARTIVNRFWKQFFGTGLSAVLDDLGAQGEWPTHPELLDWLAVEFMDSGWDVKHMVRLMVTSATYRQSSNLRPELREIDPANRLLASQSPRRLEAEFVRDNALAISDLLNRELGGPGARPYQPPGYYANLQFPDRDYVPHKDDRQYRRGVYSHWQRTFLHPMLANFDAPSREECTAMRVISNTPQQALTLLNDPSFVEASRVFAEKLLALARKSDDERLDVAFHRALARPVKPREKESLLRFLNAQREFYRANGEAAEKLVQVGLAKTGSEREPAELAAWTQVCRVVMNLHEAITIY